jgi:GxxExxY protein
MSNIVYKEESYAILGACFEVYQEKGCGFQEAVYQECLEIELRLRRLPVVPHPQLPLEYKGQRLVQKFIPDFVCFGGIILEIKAVESLVDPHRAQVLSYLHASGFKLGLLVNFGHHPKLEHQRLVL